MQRDEDPRGARLVPQHTHIANVAVLARPLEEGGGDLVHGFESVAPKSADLVVQGLEPIHALMRFLDPRVDQLHIAGATALGAARVDAEALVANPPLPHEVVLLEVVHRERRVRLDLGLLGLVDLVDAPEPLIQLRPARVQDDHAKCRPGADDPFERVFRQLLSDTWATIALGVPRLVLGKGAEPHDRSERHLHGVGLPQKRHHGLDDVLAPSMGDHDLSLQWLFAIHQERDTVPGVLRPRLHEVVDDLVQRHVIGVLRLRLLRGLLRIRPQLTAVVAFAHETSHDEGAELLDRHAPLLRLHLHVPEAARGQPMWPRYFAQCRLPHPQLLPEPPGLRLLKFTASGGRNLHRRADWGGAPSKGSAADLRALIGVLLVRGSSLQALAMFSAQCGAPAIAAVLLGLARGRRCVFGKADVAAA
mmetsp:Transcript_100819/g.282529  ORF Transcript_100819/g.282529 Transcript_100819/m.282529 type:complete len:419 (+) Transcript_100819:243-1499(+)